MLFEAREALKTLVEILYPIKPAINVAPGTRPLINHSQVSFADDFIDGAVRFRKEIAQIHLNLAGRDTSESVAASAGCAIMPLSLTGAAHQDFFHYSVGKGT